MRLSRYLVSGEIHVYDFLEMPCPIRIIPFSYCTEAYDKNEAIEYATLWAERCHSEYDVNLYKINVIEGGEVGV